MKKFLLAILLSLVLCGVALADGTQVKTDVMLGNLAIRQITWAWTSGTGVVDIDTAQAAQGCVGTVLAVKCFGDDAADPTDSYDVTWWTDDGFGNRYDRLNGVGMNFRNYAAAVPTGNYRYPVESVAGYPIFLSNEPLYFSVAAAGNSKIGSCSVTILVPGRQR